MSVVLALYALYSSVGLFEGFWAVWGVRGRAGVFMPCMRLL